MTNADDQHEEHSAAYRRGMDELRKHLRLMADAHIQKIKMLTIQGFTLPQKTGDQSSPLPP